MNTNETPQPQTSISQMTPLPGESVQAFPDLFRFLLSEWVKHSENRTSTESNTPTQEMIQGAELLQDFSEKYFRDTNPPVQATVEEGRVVIALSDNKKVQVGSGSTEEFVPGAILPTTTIKV